MLRVVVIVGTVAVLASGGASCEPREKEDKGFETSTVEFILGFRAEGDRSDEQALDQSLDVLSRRRSSARIPHDMTKK